MHETFFEMQFGFRTGHSTEHALVSLSEKLSALLIAAMLAVEFSLTCKGPLIQSTIESYCKNWNIMVSGELPFSGSSHTCITGNSLFR